MIMRTKNKKKMSFHVSAICQFYGQPRRKLGLWVVWPENNEPLKMIVIDDPSAPSLNGPNTAALCKLQTIRDKSIGCYEEKEGGSQAGSKVMTSAVQWNGGAGNAFLSRVSATRV